MLESLQIKNTAVIDSLTIEFGEGMNALTGETGAGKSIIIDSLCCLLGERCSKESIRHGENEAQVCGVFSVFGKTKEKIEEILNEAGIEPEEDGTVILSRSYNVSGKNVCRVNQRQVTLSCLRQIGEELVDVHGQHASHALFSASTHIKLLDSFAGDKIDDKLAEYKNYLGELKNVNSELKEISGDPKERARLIDLLQYQADEINAAELKPCEEEELLAKQKMFDNSELVCKVLDNTLANLSGGFEYGNETAGACDIISEAKENIEKIASLAPEFGEIAENLNNAYCILMDCEDSVRASRDNQNFSEEEAEACANRIDLIYDLKQKYGKNIGEILAYGKECEEKLDKLLKSTENAENLLKKKKNLIEKLTKLAGELNDIRIEAGKQLSLGVIKNLEDMEMGKVKFAVSVELKAAGENGEGFDKNGLSNVEFVISTNPGEPFKPLTKIASGGELSRIMLAIKSVLAEVDEIPVLVFDEIDTGISGFAAIKVAEKFKMLSNTHKVICVSHLAQIAAAADNNIVVKKSLTDDSASTYVINAKDIDKTKEVARLLGGDENSEIALEHANELINKFNG